MLLQQFATISEGLLSVHLVFSVMYFNDEQFCSIYEVNYSWFALKATFDVRLSAHYLVLVVRVGLLIWAVGLGWKGHTEGSGPWLEAAHRGQYTQTYLKDGCQFQHLARRHRFSVDQNMVLIHAINGGNPCILRTQMLVLNFSFNHDNCDHILYLLYCKRFYHIVRV